MAEPARIQFAAQAYQAVSLPLDAQQCINMYVERSPQDAKDLVPIYGCPGVVPLLTLGDGPVLGVYAFQGNLLAVAGQQLLLISPSSAITVLGRVSLERRPSISDNGTQVCLVDGVTGWIYQPGGVNFHTTANAAMGATTLDFTSTGTMASGDTLNIELDSGAIFTTTINGAPALGVVTLTAGLPSSAAAGNIVVDPAVLVAQITDPNFSPANTVAYFDGYFCFDKAGTNQFFLSSLNDGTQYSSLDYASANTNPGFVLAVWQIHEMLTPGCQRALETWYDAGTLDFPFARFDGGTIQRGLAGSQAFALEDNTVFWLGEDGVAYRQNGFTPVRISTHALEAQWSKYPMFGDCFCMNLTWNGHKWIVFTFPSGKATFVYDVSTSLWHQRISWSAQNQDVGGWRVNCLAFWNNGWYVGDMLSGRIGVLSDGAFTEWGNTILALTTSNPRHLDRRRMFMPVFELDVETGVGLATGQGSNPQWMLDWSDDGARTWSQQQLWRSAGALGDYTVRLRWNRMGQARQRVWRLQMTDPVKRAIIGTYALERPGMG